MGKRGQHFQRATARWLRRSLTVSQVELEKLAQGKNGRYYTDVHAREHRPYRRWIGLGIGVLSVGAILVLTGTGWLQWFAEVSLLSESVSLDITGQHLGIAGIVCLIVGFPFLWLGRRRRDRPHRTLWVECKDLNRPVSVADVKKLVTDVDDVLRNDAADWRPDAVMMFARRGYVDDASSVVTDPAYRTVQECEIRLYQQRGKKANAFDLVLFKR